MSIKLIAIDMDETFLRTDKSYDRERFKEIYAELKKRDVIWLVASGNSYHQLVEQFDETILPDLYFAGDNGSFIVRDEEVLETCGMERDLYLEIIDFIQEKLGECYFISTGSESYIRKNSPIYDEAKIYNGILYEIDDYREIPEEKKLIKSRFIMKRMTVWQIINYLQIKSTNVFLKSFR
ncbi:HAD hydrolase family protein [Aerococcaceae bacterium DSM 111020]|nr:HAD hydrolase family protein [Aerococcaceae bacterium DSM 111020]